MRQGGHRHSPWTVVAAAVVGALIGGWATFGLYAPPPVPPRPDQRESAQRGHDLAVLVCARCHGVTAAAKSPNPQAPPFPTLISRLSEEGLLEQLEIGLSLGHRPMPPWHFSTEQADDLLTYMVSLEGQ